MNEVTDMAWDVQHGDNFYSLKHVVTLAIFTTAALDGITSYPEYHNNSLCAIMDFVCLLIFIFEMTIKILAQGNKPWRFFTGLEFLRWEEWNEFMKQFKPYEPPGAELGDRGEPETEIETSTTIERKIVEVQHSDPKTFTLIKEKIEEECTKIVTTTEYVYYEFSEKDAVTEEDRHWNKFDFTVVSLCVYVLISASESAVGTLRLLRILRLIRTSQDLRSISQGLFVGIYASGSIMGLFMFIMFLYAIVGVNIFRENDPFRFLNGEVAFYSLYGMSNMEWLDVVSGAFYGCNNLKAGGFYMIFMNRTHPDYAEADALLKVVPNYFDGLEVIAQYPQVAYRMNEDDGSWMSINDAEDPVLPRELWCAPDKQLYLAIVYFTTYIVITGLIMVTLFTGAVAVAMTDAVVDMAQEKATARRQQRQSDKKKWQDIAAGVVEAPKKTCSRMISECCYYCIGCKDSCEAIVPPLKVMYTAYQMTTIKKRMMCGLMSSEWKRKMVAQQRLQFALDELPLKTLPSLDPSIVTKHIQHIIRKRRHLTPPTAETMMPKEAGVSSLKIAFSKVSMLCYDLSLHWSFTWTVNLVIMAAAVVAGIELFDPAFDVSFVDAKLLLTMQVVFSTEFAVKLISEGVHPLNYFTNIWNFFDAAILAVTLMPNANRALTSLRALRLLKLIKSTSPKSAPQLHVVLAAFNEAVMSFRYVGALWFLIIYIYAIVGIQFYGKNDPKNFGTLHGAIWTLFGASTFDGVSDLMYTQIYGCDNYGGYVEFPQFTADYYGEVLDYKLPGGLGGDDGERRRLMVSDTLANSRFGVCNEAYGACMGDGAHSPSAMLRELRGGKKKKRHIVSESNALPCEPSQGGWVAFAYFFSYTTFSALILLSILLGVIQQGMDDADARNKDKNEREERCKSISKDCPSAVPYLNFFEEIFDNIDSDGEGKISDAEIVPLFMQQVEFDKLVNSTEDSEVEMWDFVEFVLRRNPHFVLPRDRHTLSELSMGVSTLNVVPSQNSNLRGSGLRPEESLL
jgi:hypothetical protein